MPIFRSIIPVVGRSSRKEMFAGLHKSVQRHHMGIPPEQRRRYRVTGWYDAIDVAYVIETRRADANAADDEAEG